MPVVGAVADGIPLPAAFLVAAGVAVVGPVAGREPGITASPAPGPDA